MASLAPSTMMRFTTRTCCSASRAILRPQVTSTPTSWLPVQRARCEAVLGAGIRPLTGPLRFYSTVPSQHTGSTAAHPLPISASTAQTPSSPATGPAPASPARNDARLDWNTFFRLRRARRWYNLVSSAFTSAGSTVVAVGILSQFDVDKFGNQVFGLDPIVFMGLITVAAGAFGWLAGPSLGNVVFSLVYRRHKRQLAVKERALYDRIKRYRVDPSAQSMSNPVPDYYGEKISSVAGYRQWLRDQRIYNKKKQQGFL